MIPRFEFGHLYKFLVSVGVLMIATAILIPWFASSGWDSLIVTSDEYERLTPKSQSLILKRQGIASLLLRAWPWFSAAMVLLGLALVIYGVRQWKGRQDVLDKKEEYERDIAKAQVDQLTPGEIEAKTDAEVALEEAAESGEGASTQSKERSVALRSRALEIVLRVTKLLDEAFSTIYDIQSQVRVQKGTLVAILDAVLQSRSPRPVDIVVEIKYLRGPMHVANYVFQAASIAEKYESAMGRDCKALLVLVIATFDRPGSYEEHERQVIRRVDDARFMVTRRVSVALFREDELGSVTAQEVRRRVLFDVADPPD